MNATLAGVIVAVVMAGLVGGVPAVILLSRRHRLTAAPETGDPPERD